MTLVVVELIQVEISEVVVRSALGKHVVDGDQYLVGDGHQSTFVPSPSLEAIELVAQVSSFGPGCGVSRLNQGGF